ncbi:MAG: class SAM-dependent methyltransferase [Acidobacteria bacterium]|nr:class SAM-dependent methyltransferase [Acidobacteriota bacterium]
MKSRLLRWLVCPQCFGDLTLFAAQSGRSSLDADDHEILERVAPIGSSEEIEVEIMSGALGCQACGVYYPIHNGIPRMLTYSSEVAEVHARGNAAWLSEHLGNYKLPSGSPPPGEENVLRNFSTEWTGYKWTGDGYWNVSTENALNCKRYELGLGKHSLRDKLVLEVGIGIGGTADMLSRKERCEIVGIDLGYAVDQAQHYFGKNPLLHIVQASIFAPPFRPNTFDVVYTHGVLHHTFSTSAAFRSVAPLAKEKNGMLYVWLYSHEHEKVTTLRRLLMSIEGLVRPVLSRLPKAGQTAALLPTLPFYILYQNLHVRRKYGAANTAKYGWNEALHAARDRLTPPFAHRHTYEEVAEWFESAEYAHLEMLRDEQPPDSVPESYRQNVGIRGFRREAAASDK